MGESRFVGAGGRVARRTSEKVLVVICIGWEGLLLWLLLLWSARVRKERVALARRFTTVTTVAIWVPYNAMATGLSSVQCSVACKEAALGRRSILNIYILRMARYHVHMRTGKQ